MIMAIPDYVALHLLDTAFKIAELQAGSREVSVVNKFWSALIENYNSHDIVTLLPSAPVGYNDEIPF